MKRFHVKKALAICLAFAVMQMAVLPILASAAQKGLVTKGGKSCFYNKRGGKVRNKFVKVGKQTYYLGKKGTAYKGLKKIGKSYYYFDKKSRLVKNKVAVWKGKKYFFLKNGKAASGAASIKGRIWLVSKKGMLKKNLSALAKRGADFNHFLKAAGQPLSTVTTTSCSGPGMDGIYSYSNFKVYTYEENGARKIVYVL